MLFDVDNDGLKIYATTDTAAETSLALSIISFKSETINNLFINKTETKADDFAQTINSVTAKDITYKNAGITVDKNNTHSCEKRTNYALENLGTGAKSIWSLEDAGGSTLAGYGYVYTAYCFATDGKLYKLSINCPGKNEDNQEKYVVTLLEEKDVLDENLSLYQNKS